MITLLMRTVTVYALVFGIVRLMGKRQISDMQPFDLVITLLIADLASAPISDCGTPLLYGVIPILTLFILHRIVAYAALKSAKLRSFVCGHPLIVIENGAVVEDALRAANYTVSDLFEQLRIKDVFSISEAEFAILETNGSLSVLKKSGASSACPAELLVADGKPMIKAISAAGLDEAMLNDKIVGSGIKSIKDCLMVSLEDGNALHVQTKQKINKKTAVKRIYLQGDTK